MKKKIMVFLLFLCLYLSTCEFAFSALIYDKDEKKWYTQDGEVLGGDDENEDSTYNYINNAQWLNVGNNFYMDIESIKILQNNENSSKIFVTTKYVVDKENVFKVEDTEVYTEIYFDVYDLTSRTFYTTYLLYFDKKGQLITLDFLPYKEVIKIEPDTGFDNVAAVLKDIYYHPKNIDNYYTHILLGVPYSKNGIIIDTDPYATPKQNEQKTKDFQKFLKEINQPIYK